MDSPSLAALPPTWLVLPDQLTTQASALLHGRGHREPKSETFEPRWRNHLETQGWQKTSINLGLGTGCGPAFVQSLLIGSCAVPVFLKPLIGFTTSTSPFDRPDGGVQPRRLSAPSPAITARSSPLGIMASLKHRTFEVGACHA